MQQVQNERGWRGSAEVWLDAAYDALVEGGVEAVKVMPLAQRLGLSRTSFYWHFADRDALLAGLIARWQSRNSANLIARAKAPATTISEAVLNLFDCWIRPDLFDSRMEFAIRTWAMTDLTLAVTLRGSDNARIAAIQTMFETHGYAQAEAETRARTTYLTQVGYIAMRAEETLDVRLRRIPAYALTFTGQQPLPAEVAVFRDRHLAGLNQP